jgi:hypothetical protein
MSLGTIILALLVLLVVVLVRNMFGWFLFGGIMFLWWVIQLPFRLIGWIFRMLYDLYWAMRRQWYRDRSVFFAKIFVTAVVLAVCWKITAAIHFVK